MCVQGADSGMDGGGLTLPCHDQALAVVRVKIFGERLDPARVDTRDTCPGRTCGPSHTEPRRERREERGDLAALETEPMIRHRSRQREDTFDRVEPVHRLP